MNMWKIEKMIDKSDGYALISDEFVLKGLSRSFAKYVLKKFNIYNDLTLRVCPKSFEQWIEFLKFCRSEYYQKYNERLRFWSINRVNRGSEDLLRAVDAVLDDAYTYKEGIAADIEDAGRCVISDRLIDRLDKKRNYLKKALDVLSKV